MAEGRPLCRPRSINSIIYGIILPVNIFVVDGTLLTINLEIFRKLPLKLRFEKGSPKLAPTVA